MTTLMSKSSLYDMVSMIIPGFLFILCVEIILGVEVDKNFDTVTAGIVTFTISYAIGLLIHISSKSILDPLIRNEKKDIVHVKEQVDKVISTEDEDIRDYYLQYYCLIEEYPKVVVPQIESQIAFLKSILTVSPFFLIALIADIVRHGCNSCISATFPLPDCCLIPLVIVCCAILYLVIKHRQNDVYKRIFEDFHYILNNKYIDKREQKHSDEKNSH